VPLSLCVDAAAVSRQDESANIGEIQRRHDTTANPSSRSSTATRHRIQAKGCRNAVVRDLLAGTPSTSCIRAPPSHGARDACPLLPVQHHTIVNISTSAACCSLVVVIRKRFRVQVGSSPFFIGYLILKLLGRQVAAPFCPAWPAAVNSAIAAMSGTHCSRAQFSMAHAYVLTRVTHMTSLSRYGDVHWQTFSTRTSG
jgi:hypothetical protein